MSLNKEYGHELVLIHKNFSYVDNAFIIENDSTGDLHNLKLTNIIFIILMPPQSLVIGILLCVGNTWCLSICPTVHLMVSMILYTYNFYIL